MKDIFHPIVLYLIIFLIGLGFTGGIEAIISWIIYIWIGYALRENGGLLWVWLMLGLGPTLFLTFEIMNN